MMKKPGIAAILAYDGLATFEYGIAWELFGLERPELDVPWYDCRVVSIEGRRVRGGGGVIVEANAGIELLRRARTIVIPGWRRLERPPEPVLAALRAAAKRGARLMSICSGAFMLGYAGLLDGRRATTHWRYTAELAALFPAVQVENDVLYVDEGNILTSAGSAAGMDVGLHLIRRDHGARIANMVARRMVMPPHREGGQAQYVETPVSIRPGRSIGQTLDWARTRLNEPLAISDLAHRAAMSPRTFLRQFTATVGMSPNAWLQRERIGRARTLMETTSLGLAEIAVQCGYGSLETFRVAFRRNVGAAPGAYRQRFGPGHAILAPQEGRPRSNNRS